MRRSWSWPVAILLLFVVLLAGSAWMARVATRVAEVPIDTHTHPAARGGVRAQSAAPQGHPKGPAKK